MNIQRKADRLFHGGDHRRAEGNVIDEMTIHHVEVQPVGPGGLDAAGFFAELGKVARQQGRGDDDLFVSEVHGR